MAKYTIKRRYRRRPARSNYRSNPYNRTGSGYRKRYYRRGRRYYNAQQVALQKSDNLRRFTAKNNFNFLLVWNLPTVSANNYTATDLFINSIISGNRQFDRNMRDYVWMKFNYIAVKTTAVAHISHDVPVNIGTTADPNYQPFGVNDICGDIEVDVNWDLEQDFKWASGEGSINNEGFAQYPGTKHIKPGQKKPVTFLYRVPTVWRQFISTDIVKNKIVNSDTIGSLMEKVIGIYNLRHPKKIYWAIPEFWGNTGFLPANLANVAVKTYVRGYVYLGVTFRGRRIMDDGSCTITSCSADVKDQTEQEIELEIEKDIEM